MPDLIITTKLLRDAGGGGVELSPHPLPHILPPVVTPMIVVYKTI